LTTTTTTTIDTALNSSMTVSKVIAVTGATGNQGSSVVKALVSSPLANECETIRCLMRDATTEKAKELATLSPKIELVECHMGDVDSLKKAFAHAWAVFAVTDYWDPETRDKEFEYGKNLADAAKACQVAYYIWSTLDDAETISKRKYRVHHFTFKAHVTDYIRQLDDMKAKAIFIKLGMYYNNLQSSAPFKETGQPNEFVLALPVQPSTRVPVIDPGDVGPIVAAILQDPDQYVGMDMPLCSETLTYPEMLEAISQATGKGLRYECAPPEACKDMDPELLDMFRYVDEFGYFASETHPDVTLAKRLYPGIKDIRQWASSADLKF
jgi:uncharacterized protein YbjT (DUF2867 family)